MTTEVVMGKSIFSNLDKVNPQLATIGRQIETLYYEHPEQAIVLMRKFAEGSLLHFLQYKEGLVLSDTLLGNLIRKYAESNYFDLDVFSSFRNIQNLGNIAAHYQKKCTDSLKES